MNGAARLSALMAQPRPIVIVGAHDGLSARLIEEAGFEGIWASGFEISASHGIPDANILSMADNLARAKEMIAVSTLPVIADCDNGYGNAINVIHMIRDYEAAGIAAVCIEDNTFPKRCSFYAGVKRELSDVEEHALKIRAAKETQRTPDFKVIARTEALIAGWGMEEALRRGRAYADAGADVVLIHSKSKKPDEVLEFARRWDRETPLMCVPTTYDEASVPQLFEAGFKIVVFANHGIRSSIKAMRETFKALRAEGKTAAARPHVVPLNDVYEIIGVPEMKDQEKQYLPAGGGDTTAVVLAAGFEPGLMPLIADRPRAMLDIRGRTILERQIEALNTSGIKDIAVVRGYKKEAIAVPNVRTYDNDDFAATGEAVSLFAAAAELDKRVVVLYGDVLFDGPIVEKLLRSSADVTVVVDRSMADLPVGQRNGRPHDYVELDGRTAEPTTRFLPSDQPVRVAHIGPGLDPARANGEFIGLCMLTRRGCELVRAAWEKVLAHGNGARKSSIPDLLQRVIDDGGEVRAVDIYKGWTEISSFDDYQRAWASLR